MSKETYNLGAFPLTELTPIFTKRQVGDELTEPSIRFGDAVSTQEVCGLKVVFKANSSPSWDIGTIGEAIKFVRDYFNLEPLSAGSDPGLGEGDGGPYELYVQTKVLGGSATSWPSDKKKWLAKVSRNSSMGEDEPNATVILGMESKPKFKKADKERLNKVRILLRDITAGNELSSRAFDYFDNYLFPAQIGKYTFRQDLDSTIFSLKGPLAQGSRFLREFQEAYKFKRVDLATGKLEEVENYKLDEILDQMYNARDALKSAFKKENQFHRINDAQGLNLDSFNSDVSFYIGFDPDYNVSFICVALPEDSPSIRAVKVSGNRTLGAPNAAAGPNATNAQKQAANYVRANRGVTTANYLTQFSNAHLFGYTKEAKKGVYAGRKMVVLNMDVDQLETFKLLNNNRLGLLLLLQYEEFIAGMRQASEGSLTHQDILAKYIYNFPDSFEENIEKKKAAKAQAAALTKKEIELNAEASRLVEDTKKAELEARKEKAEKIKDDMQVQVETMGLLNKADDVMSIYHGLLNFLDIQSIVAQLLNCAIGSFDLVDAIAANCKAIFKLAIKGNFDMVSVLYFVNLYQSDLPAEDGQQAAAEFCDAFDLDPEELQETIGEMQKLLGIPIPQLQGILLRG